MIEVQGLSKSFGDIQALNNVSFTVQKGQIVGFLGANGAGKTTTMDILCGCSGADYGEAKIAGYDIALQPNEAKRRLGYLPDEPPLHSDMVVRDFIEYAAKLRRLDKSIIKKRVDETLDKLSLGEVSNRLVGNLSKGYKQRVGLAQAIVHDPEVLVLDEPTEGLDPNQIIHIRELIRSLAGQHTIILSSHILSEVQNTCDHIIIINKGQIVKQGTYEELVQNIGKTRHYFINLKSKADKFAEKISSIQGVSEIALVDTDPHRVDFTMDGSESVIDQVAKLAIDGGYGLREIASKTKTLEEIFFQLTR